MKIAIVGLGLIGGSMAKALKMYTDHEVWGLEQKKDSAQQAFAQGAVDRLIDPQDLKECDLIILALYPETACQFLIDNQNNIGQKATVTDLCGIKRRICSLGEKLGNEHGFTFIGGHPMAGKEVWGFENACGDLFEGASMILTTSERTPERKLFELVYLYKKIRFGRITITTPEEHDAEIAYTSQLAHILSSAYVKSPAAQKHVGFSAGSFQDLTRVASMNEQMWSGIFLENQEELLKQIDILIFHLQQYRDTIASGDRETLISLLKTGSDIKRNL